MPQPDFVLRLNDTLEPLTIVAKKSPTQVIDEDITTATVKFSLKTWTGELLLDHVNATVVSAGLKELGFDWTSHIAALKPSPIFYHHKAWFTLTIGTAKLSVPNDSYLYIRIATG
jgi:hypothetical protein